MRLRDWSHRERGGALKVILLIVGGLILLAVFAALFGLHLLRQYVQLDVDKGAGEKRVELRTPVADFSVERAEDAAKRIRLPIYPGAAATKEAVSMRMRSDVDDEPEGFTLTVAKFYSTDSLDKIDAWYGKQLGSEFIRQKGRVIDHDPGESGDKWKVPIVEPGGEDIVYKQEHKDHVRLVALQRRGGQVDISLVEVHPVESQ